MIHSEATSGPITEISAIPDRPRLEENLEVGGVEKVTETRDTHSPTEQNEQDDAESATKKPKSLSFKLAFIGLAASLFVFQLDATCLSIALPVSHRVYSHPRTTQILMPITRPLLGN
ncbi:hypothetical protein N7445_000034 [Penicillium cf. griseofulvum]|nr:hypothetical protein N7445_000034 [Penicillium cf. griseofulvum]